MQPLQQWRLQALLNLLRVALVLALPALALDSYNALQEQEIIPTIFMRSATSCWLGWWFCRECPIWCGCCI